MAFAEQHPLAGLFGAVPHYAEQDINGVSPDVLNKMLQVFDRQGWEPLFKRVQNNWQAGTANFHRAQYNVLPNKFLNIEGNYKV